MVRIAIAVLLLVFLFEGIGITVLERLKVKNKGFAAPLGFVFFFAALQLCYYPAQFFNLSFTWVIVSSIIVILGGIILTAISFKKTVHSFFHRETFILLLSLAVFIFVLSKCNTTIGMSQKVADFAYANAIINANHINIEGYNVLYQGYYQFAAFMSWVMNVPASVDSTVTVISSYRTISWAFSLIYSIISSMFIINLISYFNLRNKWLALCILGFGLFFTNLYYWKIVYAYSGSTYRTLFIAILIFTLYRWIKEENEQIKYVACFVIGAGLAFSASMMFICNIVLYGLMVYLFITNKDKTLFDVTTLYIPIALYTSIQIMSKNLLIGLIIFVILWVYYIARYYKWLRRLMYDIEDFMFDHAKKIFLIIVPLLVAIISLLLIVLDPENTMGYLRYFDNHTLVNEVKDYFFIYSNWIDNIVNVIRWFGVGLLIFKAKKSEDRFVRCLIYTTMILFLNPLCVPAIARYITGVTYYEAFEVLFNPFLDMVIMFFIYDLFQWNKVGQWVMEIALIVCIVFGNVFSFYNIDGGLYRHNLNQAKIYTKQ